MLPSFMIWELKRDMGVGMEGAGGMCGIKLVCEGVNGGVSGQVDGLGGEMEGELGGCKLNW